MEEIKQFLKKQLEIAKQELNTSGSGAVLAGRAIGKINIIQEILLKIEALENERKE